MNSGCTCKTCKFCKNGRYEMPCLDCEFESGKTPTMYKPKVITNADRIRARTDEELAEFIGGIFTMERDIWGDYDPRTVVMQEPRVEVRDKEEMLNWLKEEAQE